MSNATDEQVKSYNTEVGGISGNNSLTVGHTYRVAPAGAPGIMVKVQSKTPKNENNSNSNSMSDYNYVFQNMEGNDVEVDTGMMSQFYRTNNMFGLGGAKKSKTNKTKTNKTKAKKSKAKKSKANKSKSRKSKK